MIESARKIERGYEGEKSKGKEKTVGEREREVEETKDMKKKILYEKWKFDKDQ